jgi:hypothetical protein
MIIKNILKKSLVKGGRDAINFENKKRNCLQVLLMGHMQVLKKPILCKYEMLV